MRAMDSGDRESWLWMQHGERVDTVDRVESGRSVSALWIGGPVLTLLSKVPGLQLSLDWVCVGVYVKKEWRDRWKEVEEAGEEETILL
jgi:hypothetical protein